MPSGYQFNVFINCPFDDDYAPLFDALVFTVIRCGFNARCAREVDNAVEGRFSKICAIIRDCRFGIHDISRTELDAANKLPRFNMPLELGLFLGAYFYGGKQGKQKSCLVLDVEAYRYQKFLSDIAGQDIRAHKGKVDAVMAQVSDYFRTAEPKLPIPGGMKIKQDFDIFMQHLPAFCEEAELDRSELNFSVFANMAVDFLQARAAPPGKTAHRR
jgi:hypothetical protein